MLARERFGLGWMSTASLILLGVLAFFVFRTLDLPAPNPFPWVTALLLGVLVHELGHASMGIAVGFRILRFASWPVEFRRAPSGWTVHPHVGFSGPLGMVAGYPVASGHFAVRTAAFTAAGPVASLLFAAAAHTDWAAAFQIPWWIDIDLVALVSLTLGVNSLFPYQRSDGALLLELLRGSAETTRLSAIFALRDASFTGIRPRDLDPGLIAAAATQPDSTAASLAGQAFHYNWLIENRRLEEAERVVLEVTSNSDANVESWRLECVWLYARFLGNLVEAKLWMDKAGEGSGSISRFKASAAVALLEGRFDDAERDAQLTLDESRKLDDLGLKLALEEAAQYLLRDVAAARISSNSSNDFGQS